MVSLFSIRAGGGSASNGSDDSTILGVPFQWILFIIGIIIGYVFGKYVMADTGNDIYTKINEMTQSPLI
jgi:hypothetical protein